MILRAAQIDHHIEILRDLEKNDLAETLAAYAELVQRIADQGETGSGELAGRVPSEVVEEDRRLRGARALVSSA